MGHELHYQAETALQGTDLSKQRQVRTVIITTSVCLGAKAVSKICRNKPRSAVGVKDSQMGYNYCGLLTHKTVVFLGNIPNDFAHSLCIIRIGHSTRRQKQCDDISSNIRLRVNLQGLSAQAAVDKGPFKNDVTAKTAIFRPPASLVSLSPLKQ